MLPWIAKDSKVKVILSAQRYGIVYYTEKYILLQTNPTYNPSSDPDF
jgi:hypothetical protein